MRSSVKKFGFFFQAEDGIRDLYVTGVQTCALPISPVTTVLRGASSFIPMISIVSAILTLPRSIRPVTTRSEERRVGKECSFVGVVGCTMFSKSAMPLRFHDIHINGRDSINPAELYAVIGEEIRFFFSSRRRHTRSLRDWSSDVCSSDLSRHHRLARRLIVHPDDLDRLGHLDLAALDPPGHHQIGRASCRERV